MKCKCDQPVKRNVLLAETRRVQGLFHKKTQARTGRHEESEKTESLKKWVEKELIQIKPAVQEKKIKE